MSVLDYEERISKLKSLDNETSKDLRIRAANGAKDFKRAWIEFAQTLHAIWRDKQYEYWGYEKFEHYTERELGLKKPMALKLIKTYQFVEHQEPGYLRVDSVVEKPAVVVPEMDAISVLRLAKNRKELTKQDFQELRKQVFDNGRQAHLVRKDLTTMIKERQQLDPEEEREKRSVASLRKFLNALRSFKKDASTLKLVRMDILEKADDLVRELEAEIE